MKKIHLFTALITTFLLSAVSIQAQHDYTINLGDQTITLSHVVNCDSLISLGAITITRLNNYKDQYPAAFAEAETLCEEIAVMQGVEYWLQATNQLCYEVLSDCDLFAEYYAYEPSQQFEEQLPPNASSCERISLWYIERSRLNSCEELMDEPDFDEFQERCNMMLADSMMYLRMLGSLNPNEATIARADLCDSLLFCEYEETIALQNDTLLNILGITNVDSITTICDAFWIDQLGADSFNLLSPQQRLNLCLIQDQAITPTLNELGIDYPFVVGTVFSSNCWTQVRYQMNFMDIINGQLSAQLGYTLSRMGNQTSHLLLSYQHKDMKFIQYASGIEMTHNTIAERDAEDNPKSFLYPNNNLGESVNELGWTNQVRIGGEIYKGFGLGAEAQWTYHPENHTTQSNGHLRLDLTKSFPISKKVDISAMGWWMPVHVDQKGTTRGAFGGISENYWGGSQIYGVGIRLALKK